MNHSVVESNPVFSLLFFFLSFYLCLFQAIQGCFRGFCWFLVFSTQRIKSCLKIAIIHLLNKGKYITCSLTSEAIVRVFIYLHACVFISSMKWTTAHSVSLYFNSVPLDNLSHRIGLFDFFYCHTEYGLGKCIHAFP